MSEPRRRTRWKLVLLAFLALLALTGGAAFSQRTALQTWYYAWRLERAGEGERRAWADKLVAQGEPAVPRLLACLQKDNGPVCEEARGALERLLGDWGPKDPRSGRLADRYFEMHPSFSPPGQIAALQILPEVTAAGGIEGAAKARTMVSAALKDRSVEVRYLGVLLASRGELNLLPNVVALLDDPDARVRRAALLALGPIREGPNGMEKPLVEADQLLRYLHDPDPEVRRLCEMMLIKSRGLSERVVNYGRQLTHPDPMERLKLLLNLADEDDVDHRVWLQRLSEDPDSAVRAGAARVAAERQIDFADQLDRMMQSDSDGTVRKIAGYYRKRYP
jgi:HEAT repeats